MHDKYHKAQRIYVRDAGVVRAYSGDGRIEGQETTSHCYGLKTPKINKSHSERIQCYEIITICYPYSTDTVGTFSRDKAVEARDLRLISIYCRG